MKHSRHVIVLRLLVLCGPQLLLLLQDILEVSPEHAGEVLLEERGVVRDDELTRLAVQGIRQPRRMGSAAAIQPPSLAALTLALTFVCFPAGAKDDEFLKQFRRAEGKGGEVN